jgi:oligosaccharyltransferase complex subunit delta (ribophorin II)
MLACPEQVSILNLFAGFHLGLGAIFTLYLLFWLQLNMFETIKYLVIVGVVTFLCGNSLLASIAKKNK